MNTRNNVTDSAEANGTIEAADAAADDFDDLLDASDDVVWTPEDFVEWYVEQVRWARRYRREIAELAREVGVDRLLENPLEVAPRLTSSERLIGLAYLSLVGDES